MLNYCEAVETPFFSFFFTSGGRPVKLTAGGERDGNRGGGGGGHVKVDLVLATLSIRHPQTQSHTGDGSRSQQDHSQHPSQSQSQGQGHRVQSQNEQHCTTEASQQSRGANDISVRDGVDVLSCGQPNDQIADHDEDAVIQDVSAVLAGLSDGDRRLRDSGADQVDADIHIHIDDEEEEGEGRDRTASARQPTTSSSSSSAITSTPRQVLVPRAIRRKPKRMLDSSSEEEGE
jgi:hypothetical protein